MKPLLFLLIIFVFSCTEKKVTLEGAWNMTQGSTGGICSNSHGYLWGDLIFDDDSVFIAENQFFKGPHVPYKIEDDSIEFKMEGSPKYRFTLEDETLFLSGENKRNGCKFTESKTYNKSKYAQTDRKIIAQDTINQYQLLLSDWCNDGLTKIEKHISSEKSIITKNLNDSSGFHYFPTMIDFNSLNLFQTSQLTFSIDSSQYEIEHYDGHGLLIQFKSNDTTFYMPYKLCEDRVIELQ